MSTIVNVNVAAADPGEVMRAIRRWSRSNGGSGADAARAGPEHGVTATIRGAEFTIELYLELAERMSSGTPTDLGGGAMGSPYTVGTAFTVTTAGTITHLRYWHTAGCTPGTVHTLSLWSNAGVKLASVADAGAVGVTGYREVALGTPYAVTAGTRYRVTVSWNLFAGCESPTSPPGSASLTSLAGYFLPGTDIFPTNAGQHYHVDVVFVPPPWHDITCQTTTAEWRGARPRRWAR